MLKVLNDITHINELQKASVKERFCRSAVSFLPHFLAVIPGNCSLTPPFFSDKDLT